MKLAVFFVLLIAVVGVGMWFIFRIRSNDMPRNLDAPRRTRPEVYLEMRNAALRGSRATFGLEAGASLKQPWGVLMETGFPEGSATVVALSDGNASIYLSGSGGSIGGIGHASIRNAAQAMVALTAQFLPQMEMTTTFPLPTNGQTIFYVLTDAGAFTANASEVDLSEQRHALSRLFYAGQDIITQYRLIEERN